MCVSDVCVNDACVDMREEAGGGGGGEGADTALKTKKPCQCGEKYVPVLFR